MMVWTLQESLVDAHTILVVAVVVVEAHTKHSMAEERVYGFGGE
jgi:hypothetical protein